MTNSDEGRAPTERRKRPGRVPVSCAECRRLKTRCDRKIPCEACVKKGCAAICPDGSLVTGRNNRLILANTEELHDEIDNLRARLREVEEESKELRERLHQQQAQTPPSIGSAQASAGTPTSSSGDTSHGLRSPENGTTDEGSLVDAFGTLTLGPRGETRFYGPTARAEFLAYALVRTPIPTVCIFRLDREMLDAATATPTRFGSSVAMNDSIKQKLQAAIPPITEAYRLCNSFLEAGKFMCFPLPRKQVFEEILPAVYNSVSPTHDAPDSLALLFIIFAFGVLGDITSPPFLPQGNEYYMLARVALNLKSTLRDNTLLWVQALIYMVQYIDMLELEGTSMSWIDAGIAVKHAFSIGLNLKSCRWGLDKDTSEKRSRAFWQLFALDTCLSFGFGRPPTISLEFVECDFPPDDHEYTDENGKQEMSYPMWCIRYVVMLRSRIVPIAFGAKTPTYSIILDLDRQVREHPVPPYLRPTCSSFRTNGPMYLFMQRGSVLYKKESTLLHLHRSYFAQALQDSPEDPLRHRYGISVMAAYRSAYRLIIGLRDLFDLWPGPLARMTIAWSHLFSGAIVMCLLVTKCKSINLTKPALEQIDMVHTLFGRAASINSMLNQMQEMLTKLHTLAHAAANRMYFQRAVISELDRLGGKTRLISGDDALCHTTYSTSTCAQMGPQLPLTVSDISTDASPSLNIPQNAHPSLTQDIINFEGLGESFSFPEELYDTPAAENTEPPPQWRFVPFGGHDLVNNNNGSVDVSDFNVPDTLALDSTWQNFVQQLGVNDFTF